MVPTVILLFVLYLIVYMGTMTSSLKAENFTIADALQFPPPQVILANNIEAMAFAALKRPKNKFMEDEDSQVEESNYETWTWPSRPMIMESAYGNGLKRGPALTFLEPGPKIEEQPYQTRFNRTEKHVFQPEVIQFEVDDTTRMDFEEDVDYSKLSQEDLEADYMDERKEFGMEGDEMLTPPDTDPKAEGLDYEESRFDQLVTFKPRLLDDKSGHGTIIGKVSRNTYWLAQC